MFPKNYSYSEENCLVHNVGNGFVSNLNRFEEHFSKGWMGPKKYILQSGNKEILEPICLSETN